MRDWIVNKVVVLRRIIELDVESERSPDIDTGNGADGHEDQFEGSPHGRLLSI